MPRDYRDPFASLGISALHESAAPCRWQLQGSLITLVRVLDGERAGEYLFSGETVRRAASLYRTVAQLPYLKGSGQGALLSVRDKASADGVEEQVGLAPVKTDNPRETMHTFMAAMNDYRLGVETQDEQLEARIDDAIVCLDLREVLSPLQKETGRQAAILRGDSDVSDDDDGG